LIIEFSV